MLIPDVIFQTTNNSIFYSNLNDIPSLFSNLLFINDPYVNIADLTLPRRMFLSITDVFSVSGRPFASYPVLPLMLLILSNSYIIDAVLMKKTQKHGVKVAYQVHCVFSMCFGSLISIFSSFKKTFSTTSSCSQTPPISIVKLYIFHKACWPHNLSEGAKISLCTIKNLWDIMWFPRVDSAFLVISNFIWWNYCITLCATSMQKLIFMSSF